MQLCRYGQTVVTGDKKVNGEDALEAQAGEPFAYSVRPVKTTDHAVLHRTVIRHVCDVCEVMADTFEATSDFPNDNVDTYIQVCRASDNTDGAVGCFIELRERDA